MKKEKKYFIRFKKLVSGIINDKAKIQNLISETKGKSSHYRQQLAEVWPGLQTMFRMVKYWIKGAYTDVSTQTIVSILTAFLYFITPLDALPDFFVGGLIDDITVIGWVLSSLKKEIEKFKTWENNYTNQ